MKIVIVSRTCFPAKAPRSYRATELAKEFVRQGHDVTLYALLGDYDYTEIERSTGVRFKNLGKARFGMPSNTQKIGYGLKYRIIRFLGAPFAFPDSAMVPMVKNAIRQEGKIDLLITVAVPHIIHFAASFSDLSNVKSWIADCGDPFMGNPMNKPPFYFEWFERRWCKKCNYITIPVEDAINAYYPEYKEKIKVIPQGFSFTNNKLSDYVPNKVPTFAYSGVFYKDLRDPSKFLEYLINEKKDFKFIIYTKGVGFLKPLVDRLGDKIEIRNYVPREQLLFELSSVDSLINVTNKSGVQQPSKLIDYALTKRPIIKISTDFTSVEKDIFEEFLVADYSRQHVINNIDQYNIVNVANRFLDLAKK